MGRIASRDAGNRSMRAAGRTAWNVDDWNAAVEAFDRIYPPEDGTPWLVSPEEAPGG